MDRTRQYESIYGVYFKFVFVELAILIGEMNKLFFLPWKSCSVVQMKGKKPEK
jgi:hypothetical protein